MNEIEEYLLMIFLESIDHLVLYEKFIYGDDISMFELDLLNHAADGWVKFKKEELGRTLPETYEFFMSDYTLESLRTWDYPVISRNKNDTFKNKIKITVVNE